MIEFVLVSAFFWVPLIYFMMTLGFRLTRSVEEVELVNDVSQMFARGIDFSTAESNDVDRYGGGHLWDAGQRRQRRHWRQQPAPWRSCCRNTST